MTKVLIRQASYVCTMDGPDLLDSDILLDGGVIREVGASLDAPNAEIVDGRVYVSVPA